MALYEDLMTIDVIGPVENAISLGKLPPPNTEGKIALENAWSPERNWVDVKYDLNRRCDAWLGIYFEYYKFIPKGCRNCWKVCARPRNLKELMVVSEIQHKTGRCSKSGIEKREYTGNQGGYGSFWYADIDKGLEGGRELYDLVVKDLEGTGLKPTLKRGCTELEVQYHPSSDWDKMAEENGWDKMEKLLDMFFVKGKQVKEPIMFYKTHSLISWIKYAKAHGDPSVAEFIDQDSNVPKMEQYHQGGKHSNMNFKSTWGENGKDNNKSKQDAGTDKVTGKSVKKEDNKISIVK